MSLGLVMGLCCVSSGALAQDPPPKTFDIFDEPEEKPKPKEEDVVDLTEEAATEEEEPTLELPPEEEESPPPKGPKVLVLVLSERPSNAALAEKISRAATRGLAKEKGLLPMSLELAFDPGADQTRRQELKEGRKGVQEGLRNFVDLDLEVASSNLEFAINSMVAFQSELSTSQRTVLTTALFTFAASALFDGRAEEADRTFVALSLLEPGYSPNAKLYPSNVVSRFKEVQAEIDQRPMGKLRIETVPKGANIFVDGTFRGVGPLTLRSLVDGYHTVSVTKLGYRPVGQLVLVEGGEEAEIEMELDLGDRPKMVKGLDPYVSTDLKRALALGKELKVRYLAVLRFKTRMAGSAVTGLWLDVENQKMLSKIEDLSVTEAPEVAAQTVLEALKTSQAAQQLANTAAQPRAKAPLTQRWWFWTAVGGAVVAVAAASAAIAVSTQGDGRPPRSGVILGF